MEHTCDIIPNQDLYGLGVRIGVYAQWVAVLIASWQLRDEAVAIQATILSFQTGVMSALLFSTARENLKPPEVIVVLPLAFGGFVTAGLLRPSQTLFGSLVTMHVFGATSGYSLWFWWSGITVFDYDNCTYVTLIFAIVEIRRLRIFGIVVSTITSIFLLAMDLYGAYWVLAAIRHSGLRILIGRAVHMRTGSGSPHTKRWHVWLQRVSCTLSLIYLAVMVEATIYWNKFHGVNSITSVGQIIPFVIGIICLIQVLYAFLTSRAKNEAREDRMFDMSPEALSF
ncbi:hypothetical protein ANO14919_101310 [Xylariales sp. No.14919]|nr:hypothetical protein F5X98DRAFT_201119 [Xylaria grammica]GAW20623.1 hypothetical protein ANO14919_101310 [Xylariales sp. No.14919]